MDDANRKERGGEQSAFRGAGPRPHFHRGSTTGKSITKNCGIPWASQIWMRGTHLRLGSHQPPFRQSRIVDTAQCRGAAGEGGPLLEDHEPNDGGGWIYYGDDGSSTSRRETRGGGGARTDAGEEEAQKRNGEKTRRGICRGQPRGGNGGGGPTTLSTMPRPSTTSRKRNTRHDPVPREEHLADEGWAMMTAVENCVVWRSLKSPSKGKNCWQRCV